MKEKNNEKEFKALSSDGRLIQDAVSDEFEFISMLRWLVNPDKAEERLSAYLSLAPNKKAGDDLKNEKAETIGILCGEFLGDILAAANRKASARGDEPDPDAEEFAARRLLASFFEAVSKEIFVNQIRVSTSMTPEAAARIAKEFKDERRGLSSAILHAAKSVGESPARALEEWVTDPDNARKISGGGALSAADKEKLGEFAPLVASFMSMRKSVAAEAFGYLLAYAKSGWMANDLLGDDIHDADAKNPARKKNLARWREVAGDPALAAAKARQDVGSILIEALRERVADLALTTQVVPEKKGNAFRALLSRLSPKARSAVFNDLAGSGQIDAMLLGPDGNLTAVHSTSEVSLTMQGNEWARFISGINRLLEDDPDCLSQLVPGTPRPEKPHCVHVVFATVMATEKKAGVTGVQNGSSINDVFAEKQRFDADFIDMVNQAPYLEAILRVPDVLPIEKALEIEPVFQGWAGDPIRNLRAAVACAPAEGRRAKAFSLTAGTLMSMWSDFESRGFNYDAVYVANSGRVGADGITLMSALGKAGQHLCLHIQSEIEMAIDKRLPLPPEIMQNVNSMAALTEKSVELVRKLKQAKRRNADKGQIPHDVTILQAMDGSTMFNDLKEVLNEYLETAPKQSASKTLGI